jgi:hypothetical protein
MALNLLEGGEEGAGAVAWPKVVVDSAGISIAVASKARVMRRIRARGDRMLPLRMIGMVLRRKLNRRKTRGVRLRKRSRLRRIVAHGTQLFARERVFVYKCRFLHRHPIDPA